MDEKIHQALVGAGIRVLRVKNLSRMHDLLSSGRFDVVLVGTTLLETYKVHPGKHLWESRSPQTIMTWKSDGTKPPVIETFNLPDHISGIPAAADREAKLEAIRLALGSIYSEKEYETEPVLPESGKKHENAAEPEPPYSIPQIPPEVDILIHKKLRKVLEVIAHAGSRGTDIQLISASLWPTETRDRKKDIQIYISRLRNLLAQAFGKKYRIILAKGRYVLIESDSCI